MEGVLVLNASYFCAKRKMKSINIRLNRINKTFLNHEICVPQGQNAHQKVGF
jgi:hypothetical protein